MSISLFLSISEKTLQEEPAPEETTGVTVEDLMVNKQIEDVVLSKDEPTVITATITNESDNITEIILSVKMDGRLFDHRHDWTYTLEPGETKEIEEVRETHHSWYQGNFTVEIGDQMINVAVE